MPDQGVTVSLPFETTIIIQSFANAFYEQRVTIQPETGDAIVFPGQGLYDVLIGSTYMVTPSHGSHSDGYYVTVTVDHSTDHGVNWASSAVDGVSCLVANYAMFVVVSEDADNNTWDDATTYFTWYAASNPAMRDPEVIPTADPQYSGRA